MFFLLLTLLFGTAFICWLLRKQPAVAVVRLDRVEVIGPACGCRWVPMELTADRRSISDSLEDRGYRLGMERIAVGKHDRYVPIALFCVKEPLRAYNPSSLCLPELVLSCPRYI